MEMVRKWVKDKWKLKGSVSLSAMPDALFLFKFTAEEDVTHVLSGCWSYGRNNLSLYRWKADFDRAADLQKTAPIWVRLPGLPLEYWEESIFKWIGNSFGHFVGVDEITRSKSRLVYDHFCVQATMSKNLPNFITLKSKLGSWTQALVYENATLFYQKCRKYGHVISQCKAPSPPLLKLKSLALGEDPVPNAPIIQHDLGVGLVIPPTPGPDLPPSAVEDLVIEEYPFAESIINLLQSPAKIVEKASIPAWMVQCMSPTTNLVSQADQLEDGEIVRDPSLVLKIARSPLVAPPLNQGLSSPGAFGASFSGCMTPADEG
ncbi:hypothetical protein SUGI_1134770 [Cryptomeria japonica]|uniref:uncharacterized protein LOC131860110 n=1 Tax=Cryptomeria japonica TaxID=3369 RepID=UPI0024146A6E|nr:uncharacterized protein LOC131860110 [Cryptomeria japonica]GLJ53244.1 hypothetical protein SUGI_1134770 [Cryptomeria japonica]